MRLAALLIAVAAGVPGVLPAQGRTVSGVVRDCYIRHGVEAVRVGLSLTSPEYVSTDSAGRFAVRDAPRGAFILWARRVGYEAQQFEVFPGGDTAVTISLRTNLGGPVQTPCEVALDWQVARTLTGVVRDATTGQVVERAQVTIQATSLGIYTTKAGEFKIVGASRDGLIVTAKRVGYQSDDKRLPAGGDTTLTFYLQSSATLRPRRDTIPLLLEAALRSRDKLVPRLIPHPRPH